MYDGVDKCFLWNAEKDAWLRKHRGASFEEVVLHVLRGDLLDVLEHPNQQRYAGQRILVVRMGDYVYLVPCIDRKREVFLKTVIPSRKATRKYLRNEREP